MTMPEKKCTGECLKCSFQQQVYCSAQRTYAIMNNQEAIVNRLDRLEQMLSRFDSINLINPLVKDDAQSEAGANNRASETK